MTMLDNIRKILLIVGVALLAIGMFANINLYVSMSSTLVDKVTWGGIGFFFDVAKIGFLIIAGYIWTVSNKPFVAVGAIVLFCCLTFVSLNTLFGYTSKVTQETEKREAINSMGFKAAQASLDSSTQKLESLSGYAALDSAALQSQLDGLLKKKAGYEAELASCPKDYITKCIRPAQSKIQAVSAEIAPLQSQFQGYQSYQGALATRERALQESKSALSSGASMETMHPMFTNGARFLKSSFDIEITPQDYKVWFLALSSVLCELVASYLLFVVAIIGGRNFHSIKEEQASRARVGDASDYSVAVAAPAGQASGSYLTRADLDSLLTEKLAMIAPPAPKTVEVVDSPK